MRQINEKDMQIQEVLPNYKYVEKLYAQYPLIGNAVGESLKSMRIVYLV